MSRSASGGPASVEMVGGAPTEAQERRRARSQRQLMVSTILSKQLLDTLIPVIPYSSSLGNSGPPPPCKLCSAEGGKTNEEAQVDSKEGAYEEDSCTVCIERYEEGEPVRRLFCNHIFHQECVDPWLLKHGSCPVCRQDIVAFPDSPPPQWASNPAAGRQPPAAAGAATGPATPTNSIATD